MTATEDEPPGGGAGGIGRGGGSREGSREGSGSGSGGGESAGADGGAGGADAGVATLACDSGGGAGGGIEGRLRQLGCRSGGGAALGEEAPTPPPIALAPAPSQPSAAAVRSRGSDIGKPSRSLYSQVPARMPRSAEAPTTAPKALDAQRQLSMPLCPPVQRGMNVAMGGASSALRGGGAGGKKDLWQGSMRPGWERGGLGIGMATRMAP